MEYNVAVVDPDVQARMCIEINRLRVSDYLEHTNYINHVVLMAVFMGECVEIFCLLYWMSF